MTTSRIKISYKQVVLDIEKIAKEISKTNSINKIVAITRGGLVPAYYFAKFLGIKYIETLSITSYDKEGKRGDITVIPRSKDIDNRKHWLIVDDIIDSGRTMNLAKKFYPHAKTATIYKREYSLSPDYYSEIKTGWVVFPWEV